MVKRDKITQTDLCTYAYCVRDIVLHAEQDGQYHNQSQLHYKNCG